MKFNKLDIVVIAAIWLIAAFWNDAARAAPPPPPPDCDVSQSLLESDTDLTRVTNESKTKRRLDISVVGSGSSALAGPDGIHFSYPARLEDALKQRLPGADIKVTAHVQSRATAATMAVDLDKILSDDKPELVIWQTGTADALDGVEPEDFRKSLDEGVEKISNRRRRRHSDEHAVQPAHRIDARRLGLCRGHPGGRRAARRVVV